jgi:hypothetical protein
MPSVTETVSARTVVGWQGIRCVLPPDWNVTRFSMDRDNGSLGIDSPGSGTMTVQIRWSNAASQSKSGSSLYYLLAPYFRRWMRRPEPTPQKIDLKANLERILKETAKQAKKSKASFESSIKPEKTEGEQGERTAINFSWQGAGRGQGKIWYCATCNRIVVAQVVGMQKDQGALAAIASQLFASLHDHAQDGYDLWGLYDLQMEIPQDFRLESQKLLSGYLQLIFTRGAERIVVDRWGLANMTLKKFTLDEWFRNNALISLKRQEREECTLARGHETLRYAGVLPLGARLKAFRESRGGLRRFPTRYEGGAWFCPESNKIYAVQVLHNARTEKLWSEVVTRCVCH